MAERQRPEASADALPGAEWSVEGSGAYGDGGLGDTVVKMPRIGANGYPVQPGSARPVNRPSSGNSDDLMAPYDRSSWPGARENTSTRGEQVKVPSGTARTATAVVPPASVAAVKGASATTQPIPATATKAGKPAVRRTRKARLRVARVDPWSVMKTVFLFSVAFGIMGWVATYLLWQVLLASGLFDALNNAVAEIMSSPSNTEGFRIEDWVSANKVLGVAALLAVLNTVITTALGTLGAFLYNLSANILGGLELTLAED
ncbi:MAG: DUF3566 domain-containing protein [Propionibacteriaceae bacterium]|nr:DUF3566 domain-containing protein [Propionibacteriaceae bacterium]